MKDEKTIEKSIEKERVLNYQESAEAEAAGLFVGCGWFVDVLLG